MDNSIRTLFSLLFLFSLGSTSADSGVTLEKCATLSSMAGQIMTYRQNGSTMASVYTLNAQPENKENIDLLNELAREVFTNYGIVRTTDRKKVILEYQNRKFLKCYDSIQQE